MTIPNVDEPQVACREHCTYVTTYLPETHQIVTVAVTATEVRAYLRYASEPIHELADTILIGKVEKK